MDLKIVWRNPISLIETKRRCGELEEISWGAVYSVTGPDLTQELEVILGVVA